MMTKAKANSLHGKKDYKAAIKMYEQASRLLGLHVLQADLMGEVMKQGDGLTRHADVSDERMQISLMASNMALCHIELSEWKEACTAGLVSLAHDSTNYKAYFRVAKAFQKLKQSIIF